MPLLRTLTGPPDRPARWHLALWLVLLLSAISQPSQAQESEPELLLLEVRLDRSTLSSAIPAYQSGEHTLLPLGELARLLTLAIQTRPGEGTASGFILSRERGFSLNLQQAIVTQAGRTRPFDPALILAEPDDLYVAASLLQQWLPLTLVVDHASLSLRVHALEPLPLQQRLARQRSGERAGARSTYQDPGYAFHHQPYRLLDMPFIDQTFASQWRQRPGNTHTDSRYTAFVTGDLLGMEAALFYSRRTQDESADMRATLSRHDPGGQLLGPLRARSVRLGSQPSPSVKHIARGRQGEGLSLSNRPLTRPSRFDSQSFSGDLPPGWDVELYYNDALVGFQQANGDNRYRFDDQPLSVGRNDFRLVFNGPLGQQRTERSSFSLDQSMVPPGEFQYSLSEHRDEHGQPRSLVQFDVGLARALSASAGFVRAPRAGTPQGEAEHYTTLGLRTFWQAMSINADYVEAQAGGSLAQLGLQTRLSGVSVDASRTQLNGFSSEIFPAFTDPTQRRDQLRLSGAIPLGARSRLPVRLEGRRDQRASGLLEHEVNARVSAYLYRTAITNTLNWREFGQNRHSSGSLQLSRRVRNTSVRGQASYTLGGSGEMTSLAVNLDHNLHHGYRINLGASHSFMSRSTTYSSGFSKTLGRFGLGVNGSYTGADDFALGARLFVAMGRDPRRADWHYDARPVANSGAASVQLFLDENNNGIRDPGEPLLADVGFHVNGARHQARTGEDGIAHIDRLQVQQFVDIGVDSATLMDPQWQPQVKGMRLVPRPGRVAMLELPVSMTTEIDGTLTVLDGNQERGIGNLTLQLIDEDGQMVAETTSSWDGFYIMPAVTAGSYWLRVSPPQLRQLGLKDTGMAVLVIPGDGDYISGIDLILLPRERRSRFWPDAP